MKRTKKLLVTLLALSCITATATACDALNGVFNSSSQQEQGVAEVLHFQKIAGKEEYRVAGLGTVSSLEIVIPSTYNGLPVTEIGMGAFSAQYGSMACMTIEKVVIPDSIQTISYVAFSNCYALTELVIPKSVKNIEKTSFTGCPYLTIYCEAESKPDGWDEYWGTNSVVWDYKNNEVAEDGYIYKIIDGVRYGLKDGKATVVMQSPFITKANIPSSVTYKDISYTVSEISASAFSGSLYLTEVTIANSITKIPSYAFESCGNLKKVVLPNTVTSIGEAAFRSCQRLEEIVLPSSLKTIGASAFYQCQGLKEVIIPTGVTSIGNDAFYYCKNLTKAVIPDTVTTIEGNAFQLCSSLTIYCEAKSKPDGWEASWNYSNRPVVWGYKG